ncbi:hypothetical protein LPMP_261260 [Leishmania panamensis]|uniref:Uncharacterized protein n=1 Tax=Leishmania panamensis TaxID=5679 RepID=A0A088RVG6_LEIPA|nr:hypothetical protein LPMP_261260 [Leishmania panamensis]AIN99239.1 hypothetical protein LPMP_261260 [Leishmania panamensis]
MSTVSPWMTQKGKRSAAPAHGGAAEELRPLPAQSQLLLDPQYNVDLLTFSHIRERMRQQQQQRSSGAVCSAPSQSMPTDTPSRTPLTVVPGGTTDHSPAPRYAAASESTPPSLFDEVLSEEDSHHSEYDRGLPVDLENDLGSFLTTAGRAFAQMKRDRQSLRSRKNKAGTVIKELHQQQGNAATNEAPPSAPAPAIAAAATLGSASEASHTSVGADTSAETPAMMNETNASQSTRLTLEPSAMLEWGKDEDIDVGPFSSDASLARMQRTTGPSSSSASSLSDAAGRQAHDSAEESEDDYVGFEGGGVAVMAFLYEQTWMALVGGGPTPMGTPKSVQFIRDGELQHQLLLPDPVVRLFLDARLLFVVTTAELRMYSNPIEREWTCLRQSIPLSAAVASRYAFLASPADDATGANAPVRVWKTLPNPSPSPSSANAAAAVDSAEVLRVTSFASFARRPGGQSGDRGTWTSAISLPVIPVVIDYARSLVLLPVGEEGKGFALYRYVSGPEVRYTDPVNNADMSNSASTSGMGCASDAKEPRSIDGTAVTTGRTTSFLEHIATQNTAHRNPLYNLALYVGWPSSIARLLSRDTEAGTGDQAGGHASSSHVDGSSSGGLVTLVAASSEYATRLTLWMLHGTQNKMASQQNSRPPSPSNTATGAATFVLLREFRVGVRLAAPQVVMASFPGVSRYIARGHAALAGTSGRTATGSSEAASWTDAGLLPNTSVAGDVAKLHGTATLASASELFSAASSPPSSTPPTGTMTSWATEAAATVASSTASPAGVQHLQFVGNGAYLLCVHGTDIISIFSTSARETEEEAKNVCRDRVAAEQNRYSRLSIMKEYLPHVLSSRLEAYTRQAWSSCSGRLPSADPTFMPRWICVQRRDIPGATTTSTATVPATAPTSIGTSHGASKLGVPIATDRNRSRSRQPFFQRLTSFVGSRPPIEASVALPSGRATTAALPGTEDKPSAENQPSGATPASHSLFSRASASRRLKSPGKLLTFPTSSWDEQRPPAGGAAWGAPLMELPQCIQVWPSAPHTETGTLHQFTGAASAASSPRRPPIVLNCATCEGAFANILLFAEQGELVTSQVVPYATS